MILHTKCHLSLFCFYFCSFTFKRFIRIFKNPSTDPDSYIIKKMFIHLCRCHCFSAARARVFSAGPPAMMSSTWFIWLCSKSLASGHVLYMQMENGQAVQFMWCHCWGIKGEHRSFNGTGMEVAVELNTIIFILFYSSRGPEKPL